MNLSAPQHSRSAAGVAISAILHGLAVSGAVWLAASAPPSNHPSTRPASQPFIPLFLRAPDAPVAAPLRTKRAPTEKVDPPRVEPKPAPDVPATPRPEPKPLTPMPPAPEIARVDPAPAREAPPKPAPPPIVVGAFDKATDTAQNPAPGRQVVETAGFDTAPGRAPEMKLAASTSPGGFDRAAPSGAPRPGTDRPSGSVADAGFGGAAPATDTRRPAAQPRAEVRAGAFDVEAAQPPKPGTVRDERAAARIDVPVEILSKPTPSYTDEARALKLEGDVVLEVEFCASQEVRVLRVVRGIGHGLDEAAARAAGQIRFKPAQANGKPVNFRATLHIVFRLT